MDARVVRNSELEHYEVRVGDELAGFTQYRERPGLIAFVHTEIDPKFEGHGLGSTLIRAALDETRAEGKDVLPFCPFVNEWIKRHPDYVDLVPAGNRAQFGLPE